MNDIELRM